MVCGIVGRHGRFLVDLMFDSRLVLPVSLTRYWVVAQDAIVALIRMHSGFQSTAARQPIESQLEIRSLAFSCAVVVLVGDELLNAYVFVCIHFRGRYDVAHFDPSRSGGYATILVRKLLLNLQGLVLNSLVGL